jgi:hypothetical protein
MPRPVTLFTGQWADLPLEQLARSCGEWGFDGLELASWGHHFDVAQALRDPAYCAGRRELLELRPTPTIGGDDGLEDVLVRVRALALLDPDDGPEAQAFDLLPGGDTPGRARALARVGRPDAARALQHGPHARAADLGGLEMPRGLALDREHGPELPAGMRAFEDRELAIEHERTPVATALEPAARSVAARP